MKPFAVRLFSNPALIFILTLLIVGLVSAQTLEDVVRTCAVCALLWAGTGMSILSTAIDHGLPSPGSKKKELQMGIRAIFYGPFAHKLFR
jgi:hypothetical protein